MLVTLKGFGGIWERRLTKTPTAPNQAGRVAFYNTTGVVVDGKVRYRWRIGGKIRFNGIGGFTPNNPSRSLNRVFECKDPEITRAGWSQVLFQKNVGWSGTAGSLPVRGDSCAHGTAGHPVALEVRRGASVALSEHADEQEAMLLMPAYSWVRGELGTFYVEPSAKQFWSAELRLGRAGFKIGNKSCATRKEQFSSTQRGIFRYCSRFSVPDSRQVISSMNSCNSISPNARGRHSITELRRLLAHGLIEKRQGAARGRPQVYVISKEGASLLIDIGELFAGRIGMETGERSCSHWLDLNDLHLALAKADLLMRWTPASEICSQNDLTQFKYAKDYDAVVAVEFRRQRTAIWARIRTYTEDV